MKIRLIDDRATKSSVRYDPKKDSKDDDKGRLSSVHKQFKKAAKESVNSVVAGLLSEGAAHNILRQIPKGILMRVGARNFQTDEKNKTLNFTVTGKGRRKSWIFIQYLDDSDSYRIWAQDSKYKKVYDTSAHGYPVYASNLAAVIETAYKKLSPPD